MIITINLSISTLEQRCFKVFYGYHLFDFQLKTCKNDTLSLLLIGYFF